MSAKEVDAIRIIDILKYEPLYFYNNFRTNTYILFEDNVVFFLNYKEIILMRYILDVVVGLPEFKIDSSLCIRKHYSEGLFSGKTINNIFSKILEKIIFEFCIKTSDRSILKGIYYKMYQIVNRIYNEIVLDNTEYCSTINIKDFLEIQFTEELIKSINKVKEECNDKNILNAYRVLDKVIREKNTKDNRNNLVTCYLSGTVKDGQIKQMLAPRGYITEIDNTIFKIPVANSFTLGMNNMFYMAAESRSAAKANYISKTSVAKSEYFAREVQLVCMYVDKLVDGDCGSKDYIKWFVNDNLIDGISDLDFLVGKIYVDDKGVERIITKSDKHLVGTYINMRSPLTCKLKEKNHICVKCFGALSYSINTHANLGHLCCTIITQKITQLLLSTKHENKNASFSAIVLSDAVSPYLSIRNKNIYYFRKDVLKKYKIKMHIDQESVYIFKDFVNKPDLLKLEITRMSRIKTIILEITLKNDILKIPVIIQHNKSLGSFSHDFLEYVKNKGFSLDSNNMYIIDLEDYDYTKPFIIMPMVEYSYFNLLENVKSSLKSMELDKSTSIGINTPEQLLQNLFNTINKTGLNINIALLEVMVYAFKIRDPYAGDFNLGRDSMYNSLSSMKNVLTNRSVSAAICWEDVMKNVFFNPISYGNNANISHPLDVILCPYEAVNKYERERNET